MAKPVLYEWALDQTSLPPTSQAQWEEGFQYLNAATGGKVPTYVHDYPFSEITKAIRWTLDAIPENGIEAKNYLIGDQNFNVEGSTGDPLPSSTPTGYTVGAELTATRTVVSANLVNATFDSGLFDADSGSYYQEYDGEFPDAFYGIKLADNSIVQTGCTLSIVSGKTRITVDMSVAPAHKFAGISESVGIWPDVGDEESINSIYNQLMRSRGVIDVSGSRLSGITYTNNSEVEIWVSIWMTGPVSGESAGDLSVDGVVVSNVRVTAQANSPISTIAAPVPPGKTYRCNSSFITRWTETVRA